MTKRPIVERLKVGMTAMLLCIAFSMIVPGFFAGIEKGLLPWKYAVRGATMADSSVVIIALTGDDIDALGGLPVKRSYYALAVSALSGLGVKTTGIDLGLSDSGRSAPEYNDLLASVIAGSGNVVLSGYFRSLSAPGAPDTHSAAPAFPRMFARDISGDAPWRTGFHFTLPYAPFLRGASGLGHTNLNDELTLPLCIGTRSGVLPLFSLEVLRRSMPGDVRIVAEGGELSLRAPGAAFDIPYNEDGDVSLNFTGGTASLTMISFLDFLRACDDLQAGGEGALIPAG
ncbi:MAG TPA: CHASE2 domain-containing protein, partial [Bacteroidota bacterium]|nr:CHASE2 domain-containing protein [Bacteroidota bacterium]